MSEFECMYDGCNESFEGHTERLKHSMIEHTEVNYKKYPKLTDRDTELKF